MFESRLANSEVDVRILSDTLTRSDQEHAAVLEKCKVDHDLALSVISANALQQGREEGQQCGLATGVKFCWQQSWELLLGNVFFSFYSPIW